MGHSFLKFRGRTERMHDIDIVTVTHVVLDEIRQHPDSYQLTDQVKALADSWITDVWGPGFQSINFNEFLHTDADRDCLVGVLRAARDSLQRFGPVVPGEYLNRVVDAPGVLNLADQETYKVQAPFDEFIDLLMEKEKK
jgi:hypothetical protein